VRVYEKVLSCELVTLTASPLSDIQQNRIGQKDTELRQSQMRQLVDWVLVKTEHEAKLKQGAGHVVDVALAANNTISTALRECPEAALAWTDVTFDLQVSVTAQLSSVPLSTFTINMANNAMRAIKTNSCLARPHTSI